jgi:protein SCO1/2
MPNRRFLLWLLPAAFAAACAGLLLSRMLAQKPLALQAGTWLPEARPIAGLELTGSDARALGPEQLRGHPTLLFLGYTSCPDVCPTTLATVRTALQGEPMPGLAVLFVTVDPDRDTPEVLRGYLSAFGPAFHGAAMAPASRELLLRSLGAVAVRGDGTPYRVDHSATLYLLDRQARLVAVFTPPLAAGPLGTDLRAIAQGSLL